MTLYNREKTSRKGGGSAFQEPQGPVGTSRIDLGSQVETNYASETNGVIYIRDKHSGRFVAFKAFLKATLVAPI